MAHLVVGGAGVAGQAAIAALRARAPGAEIVATSSAEDREIAGADRVLGGVDLNDPGAADALVSQIESTLDTLIFTPAWGPVGFPAPEATLAEVAAARAFSLAPLERLRARLRPVRAVAFSTFWWLPETLQAYGAMAHAKRELEQLALASRGALRVLRAGLFTSRSSKALALAVYQQIRRGRQPGLAAAWSGSTRRFFDFFHERAERAEAAAFAARFTAPYRRTTPADLRAALADLLAPEGPSLLNRIGDWVWSDTVIPALPEPASAPPEHRIPDDATDA